MNVCALKPTMPFITKTELKRTPATEDNRKMVEFMDSHDFTASIDRDSKELIVQVSSK